MVGLKCEKSPRVSLQREVEWSDLSQHHPWESVYRASLSTSSDRNAPPSLYPPLLQMNYYTTPAETPPLSLSPFSPPTDQLPLLFLFLTLASEGITTTSFFSTFSSFCRRTFSFPYLPYLQNNPYLSSLLLILPSPPFPSLCRNLHSSFTPFPLSLQNPSFFLLLPASLGTPPLPCSPFPSPSLAEQPLSSPSPAPSDNSTESSSR